MQIQDLKTLFLQISFVDVTQTILIIFCFSFTHFTESEAPCQGRSCQLFKERVRSYQPIYRTTDMKKYLVTICGLKFAKSEMNLMKRLRK